MSGLGGAALAGAGAVACADTGTAFTFISTLSLNSVI